MADGEKNPEPVGKNGTTVQKATITGEQTRTEEPVSGDFPAEGQKVGVQDGTFVGDTRYEGTVLVEREIEGDWVTVMTDKPREGDKIQAQTLNPRTGELEQSSEGAVKPGANRMPGKAS